MSFGGSSAFDNGLSFGGSSAFTNGSSASSNSANGSPFSWNPYGDNSIANIFGQANDYEQASWRQSADFNAEQAKISRDWSKMMSDTAVQRRVEDLRKAGFSPLSILKMGEASDGTATSATATKADNAFVSAYENYLDYLGYRQTGEKNQANLILNSLKLVFNAAGQIIGAAASAA